MEFDLVSILILMISNIKSRRRKIYYVPGLISLICLPFIFFNHLPSTKVLTALNYISPSSSKENPNSIFSGENFMEQISKKKIIPFYLDEDHELNKKKFTIIEAEALRLKFTCDTNQVIGVQISDNIQYGEFIFLLNLMNKHKFKRYAEWKNIFYILGEEPPDSNEIMPIYL